MQTEVETTIMENELFSGLLSNYGGGGGGGGGGGVTH